MPTSPAPIARSPFVVIASAPLLSGRAPGIGQDYGRNTGPIFAPEVSTSTAARLSNLLPASINRGG
jgi:hypothetical protein